MIDSGSRLELVSRAHRHGSRTAIVTSGAGHSYVDLLRDSATVATALLDGRVDLEEDRVVFLVPPGFAWVAVQWGIWRAGGVAVPLAVSHPPPELAYVLEDADPVAAVVHPDLLDRIQSAAEAAGVRVVTTDRMVPAVGSGLPREGGEGAPVLPSVPPERGALMLYTSGTTGRPKGVVTTHANLKAQVTSLVDAWGWKEDDAVVLVLPLHHVHGIVNVLTCALWSGATCHIPPRFDPVESWETIAGGSLTLFMAVPTVYARLLTEWEAAPEERRKRWSSGCRTLRLMVSGSAALPVSMLERWREVTGHTLLERYGMTEIGMALSNPLEGPRRPGFVGRPLPGVEVRLVDEDGEEVAPGTSGEILVRGPTVFREYWRRPRETREAFRGEWFRTGDVAVTEEGDFRILGRRSVDIIKTGGYKVSALEVEEILRTHPLVADCAVVSLPDPEWGELVAAAIVGASVPSPDCDPGLHPAALRSWAKERMAPYKAPTRYLFLPELPRNVMGKVTKPRIRELFGEGPDAGGAGSGGQSGSGVPGGEGDLGGRAAGDPPA